MKSHRRLALLLFSALLLAGCADKQKEAERMEQEMREMEADVDTGRAPGEVAVDTVAETGVPADVHAVPEEATPELAMPGRPAGSGFAVQVASCEDAAYASYLVELYTERGYQPYVTGHTEGGRRFHRVRIGLLETLAEAEKLKAELADKFSVEAWIDRE